MLSKAQEFLSKNTKNIFWIFAILGLFFIDLDISFADGESKEMIEKLNFWIALINVLLKIIAAVMAVATAFVSLFLQPTWVNGSFMDMNVYLKEIWILVSNVVYVIFAFLLIIIAFANIIGKGQDKFALKQALPKFIVGVLIVPFSWFAIQFMISLSGILTVGALTMPYETFEKNEILFPTVAAVTEGGEERSSIMTSEVCVKWMIHLGEIPDGIVTQNSEGEDVPQKDAIYCKPEGKINVEDILKGEDINGVTGGQSIYSLISLYTFGIVGIETLDNIDGEMITEGGITRFIHLLTRLILSLVFVLVYFILLMSLFYILFIRILYIWIFMMLSPAFGLMYFFGKSGGEGAFKHFNFKEVFALIMTPVYVSLALSFGFMFMVLISSGFKDYAGDTDKSAVNTLNLGIIEVEMTGTMNTTLGGLKDETDLSLASVLQSFKGLGGVLGEIIVMIFGIGILWVSVMAALKQSEITKAAIQPIESFGNQVGKLAASSPMYAPIIPTGKGFTSAAGISEVKNRQIAQFKNKKLEHANQFEEMFGIGSSELANVNKKSTEARNTIGTETDLNPKYINAIKDATFEASNASTLANSDEYVELLSKAIKDAGLESKVNIEKGDKGSIAQALHELDKYLDDGGNTKGNILGRESNGKASLSINDLDKILNNSESGSTSGGNQTNSQETINAISGIRLDTLNNIEIKNNSKGINTVDESKIGSTEKSVLTQLEKAVKDLKEEDKTEENVRKMLLADRSYNNTDSMDAVIQYLTEKGVFVNKNGN